MIFKPESVGGERRALLRKKLNADLMYWSLVFRVTLGCRNYGAPCLSLSVQPFVVSFGERGP